MRPDGTEPRLLHSFSTTPTRLFGMYWIDLVVQTISRATTIARPARTATRTGESTCRAAGMGHAPWRVALGAGRRNRCPGRDGCPLIIPRLSRYSVRNAG